MSLKNPERITIGAVIIFFIILAIIHWGSNTSGSAYKRLDNYLTKTYGEEFFIGYMGRRKINDKEWYEARVVYPKSYIGTHKENDPYYWGTGFVEIYPTNEPGDNYGAVLLKESANEFYGKRLKKLFGENVLAVFELDGYYERTNFLDEIIRRGYLTEERNFHPLRGRIYIFGRVRNDEDKEWYRKQIYEFVKYMKGTKTFDYTILSINIIDERILADDALSYIEKMEKIEDVNKDFDILNEVFEKTSKEDIKLKIENLPRTDTYELLNRYHGYLLFSSIVSPKEAKYITQERNAINYYERVEDVTFEGEVFEPKLEGETVKEYGEDESYYITELKNGMRNGESKQYNKEGNIIWTGTYKDNLLQGSYKKYYDDGKLYEEGTYRDNLLQGSYKKYYDDGKLREEGTYKDNLLHGNYKKYAYDGDLYEEGTYKNGLFEGEVKIFYYPGKIEILKNYKNGKLDGIYKKYYEDGKICEKAEYKDGVLNGIYMYYDRYGVLLEEIEYKNDKYDGVKKLFYDNGNPKSEEMYKDGDLNGTSRYYFENGNLESEKMYKDDELNGTSKYYFENGNLESELNYLNGRNKGEFKYYYENGNLKKVFNHLSNEKKVGEEKVYYPDGTIHIINIFDEDGDPTERKVFNESGKMIRKIEYGDFLEETIKEYREDDGTLESAAYYKKYKDGSNKWNSEYDYAEYNNGELCDLFKEYDRNGNVIKSSIGVKIKKKNGSKLKKMFKINDNLK